MKESFAFGIVLGFGFGAILASGVFYCFYMQVSRELFDAVDKIQKTVGWLNIKVRSIVDDS